MSALLNPDEFDNESLESFWSSVGTNCGTYTENASAMLRVANGSISIGNSGGQGETALQIKQPAANSQDFDVKIKVEKISGWGGSSSRVGLIWTSDVDPGSIFMWLGWTGSIYGYIRAYGKWGGGTKAETILNHGSGLGPIYLRLARTGNTFDFYYSADGTSWTPGTSVTHNDFLAASEVGIICSDNSCANNVADVHWFRNYNVTYKFGGTISHDGEVIVIADSPAEGEIAREDKTAGGWEILTAFSGTCSVMGRRSSDDKTVSFGGLDPVYHSGP